MHVKSKREQNEKDALLECNERYRLLIETSENLWDWNMMNNSAYISKSWSDLMGFNENEVFMYSQIWTRNIHPLDVEKVKEGLKQCIKEKKLHFLSEYRLKTKEGNYIWVCSKGNLFFNKYDKPIRISGSHSDITEKKNMEGKLKDLMYKDQLTGAVVRTAFMDRLKDAIDLAKGRGKQLSVLFLDIDNFKAINDIYGHHIGDIFLKKIADRVKKCIRSVDILGRIGGDEFAILISEDQTKGEENIIAQRIVDSFLQPIIVGGYLLSHSVSVGIANYPRDGKTGKTLLRRADIAMYKAKEEGKNNLRQFNYTMLKERALYDNIRRDLKDAVAQNELFLCYQPLFDAKTKKVVRIEALIRWKHAKNGIVNPMDFIPVAENTKLIIPIGEWVLKTAFAQLKQWKNMGIGNFRLSINASVIQLQDTDFTDMVLKMLAYEEISPECIEIEITESVLMISEDNLLTNLARLQILGVKISIDDYGTGYNSLKYIQKIKVDCIKIDKSFIDDIHSDINKLIIKHIISLGHSINAEMIAEGVETKAQYEFLKNQGCDIIQGYYFCKPLLPDETTEFLKN